MGIHLEGPCLSVEYKGAMPESLLMKEARIDRALPPGDPVAGKKPADLPQPLRVGGVDVHPGGAVGVQVGHPDALLIINNVAAQLPR